MWSSTGKAILDHKSLQFSYWYRSIKEYSVNISTQKNTQNCQTKLELGRLEVCKSRTYLEKHLFKVLICHVQFTYKIIIQLYTFYRNENELSRSQLIH